MALKKIKNKHWLLCVVIQISKIQRKIKLVWLKLKKNWELTPVVMNLGH